MPSVSRKLVYRSAIQTINYTLRQCIFWIVLVISPIDIEWQFPDTNLEQALKTYTGYNTASSIKRSMSDTLSESLRCDATGLTWGTTTQFKMYRDRLSQAYHLATEAGQKARQKQKEGYNIKIRGAAIKQGDRVLVKVVSFGGKHKLTDRWEQDPYIILS